MKRQAMIHSISEIREVEIIQYKDSSHIIVSYDDAHMTAIDNPFTGLIYADDLYGLVTEDFRY